MTEADCLLPSIDGSSADDVAAPVCCEKKDMWTLEITEGIVTSVKGCCVCQMMKTKVSVGVQTDVPVFNLGEQSEATMKLIKKR